MYYSSVYLCIPTVVATRMRARGKGVVFALYIRNFRVRARAIMQMHGTGVRCVLVREYNPTLRNGTNRIRRSAHLQKIKLYTRFTPSRKCPPLFLSLRFLSSFRFITITFPPAYLYTYYICTNGLSARSFCYTRAHWTYNMYVHCCNNVRQYVNNEFLQRECRQNVFDTPTC